MEYRVSLVFAYALEDFFKLSVNLVSGNKKGIMSILSCGLGALAPAPGATPTRLAFNSSIDDCLTLGS